MPERPLAQLQHISLWRDGVDERGYSDEQARIMLNTAIANQEDLDNLRQIINTLIDVINGHAKMISAVLEHSDLNRESVTVVAKALDQLADNTADYIADLNRRVHGLEQREGLHP